METYYLKGRPDLAPVMYMREAHSWAKSSIFTSKHASVRKARAKARKAKRQK